MSLRPVSDRLLRRWLTSGRPRWVGKRIQTDPAVAARLETMTALDVEHVESLVALVQPAPAFPERVVVGMHARIDALETLGVIVDLMGVGWQTSRALMTDQSVNTDPPESARSTDEY